MKDLIKVHRTGKSEVPVNTKMLPLCDPLKYPLK